MTNQDKHQPNRADLAAAQASALSASSQGSPELRSDAYPNAMVRASVQLPNGVNATLLVDESAVGWALMPGGGIMALLLKQTETVSMAFARARDQYPDLSFLPLTTSALQQPRPVDVLLTHPGVQELH